MIDPKELKQAQLLTLSLEEANMVRQWFHAVLDCNPSYLEAADLELGERIVAAVTEAWPKTPPATENLSLTALAKNGSWFTFVPSQVNEPFRSFTRATLPPPGDR